MIIYEDCDGNTLYPDDVIKLLEAQLKEARKVIGFYSEPNNWSTECFNVDEDIEWLPNGKNSADLWENVDQHGGKRAREFLSKYPSKSANE